MYLFLQDNLTKIINPRWPSKLFFTISHKPIKKNTCLRLFKLLSHYEIIMIFSLLRYKENKINTVTNPNILIELKMNDIF